MGMVWLGIADGFTALRALYGELALVKAKSR
jgi:hypothetical protein